jgi:dimeric dUTPase (all-alpha-NTP-PPase superfamily)
MFDRALRDQREVQRILGEPMGDTKDQRLKENALALMMEANEVMNELAWKPWKTYDASYLDEERLKYELADCIIFILNMYNEIDCSAEEICEIIHKKQDINIKRYGKPDSV